MTAVIPGETDAYGLLGVYVTLAGTAQQLECDHGDGEGDVITDLEPGKSWDELCAEVAKHQAEHRCGPAQDPHASPELGADSDLVALAAACSHRDVLAAALARIEGLTSGYYDPGTNEYDVHEIAMGALSFRAGNHAQVEARGNAVTATPSQTELLARVDAHFVGNGPYPLQLVCITEDASSIECDQTITEVEPGITWDELEARIAAHAIERHATAAQKPHGSPEQDQNKKETAK